MGVYGCNSGILVMQLQLGKLSVLRRDAISSWTPNLILEALQGELLH
jgi:hypothetical protein